MEGGVVIVKAITTPADHILLHCGRFLCSQLHTTMTLLITGATGQIGSELVPYLRRKYGADRVVVGLHHNRHVGDDLLNGGPTVTVDATDRSSLERAVTMHGVTDVYHLVGVLSARGEQDPPLAWRTNMDSLKHVLDLAVERKLRVFWPSSIAAFGPTTPRDQTPQQTVLEPSTMYGVTKVAGELLVNYYVKKYGIDVRSLRLPGIISWKTEPGGGTTDYAVAMFYEALQHQRYTCFVRPDTVLPMMYMDDALLAIDQLMSAPADSITIRTSYNLTALSFTAAELAAGIASRIPGFSCSYEPDFRQAIADSWPRTIDDRMARRDWGWKPNFTFDRLIDEMLGHLRTKLGI